MSIWMTSRSLIPSPTLRDRLVAGLKFDPATGCWIWTKGTSTKGRGVIRFNTERMVTTHKAAAFLWLGVPIVSNGVLVCHDCDRPLCCRPQPGHLYVGDYTTNIHDAYDRGQRKLKLTEQEVYDIKNIWIDYGWSQRRIAEVYGVSQQHISNILMGARRERI